MNCNLSYDGILKIIPETEEEYYALMAWQKEPPQIDVRLPSWIKEIKGVEDQIRKLLRCPTCGEPYINAIDSRTGKISNQLYKGNCEHIPKNMRISVG